MEYFYSHIAENDLNRDFIDALRNYAEEVKEQIYLLQHPLTDSKYSYEVHDVGIVLMRKHKIAFVSFKKDNKDQFVSVSAILSCRPFFILIFLLCIKMKHYGFSRKSIWKNLETFP